MEIQCTTSENANRDIGSHNVDLLRPGRGGHGPTHQITGHHFGDPVPEPMIPSDHREVKQSETRTAFDQSAPKTRYLCEITDSGRLPNEKVNGEAENACSSWFLSTRGDKLHARRAAEGTKRLERNAFRESLIEGTCELP